MRPRAVFMDIDGTLTQSASAPSDEVIKQITYARTQGHQFFLCTGRAQAYIPEILRNAPYLDGYVAGSGTHVVLHGRTLYSQRVPLDALRMTCEMFLGAHRRCLFEGETALYGITDPHAQFGITDASDFDTKYAGAPITKLTVSGKIQPQDKDILGRWFDFFDMGDFYEAILCGNTKATGMQKMLATIGLSQSDSIAIGDGANDIPMFRYAGIKIAMGNAPQFIQDIADYVTATCACDGVAIAIKEHVLGT